MEKKEAATEDDHYYANACHVCRAYGKEIRLKRCGSCKMIAYCSQEHQKKHWPEHKEICQILSKRLKDTGTLYPIDKSLKNREVSWENAKLALTALVQMQLFLKGRNLHTYEVEMLCCPRSCEICHETDFVKLKDCAECPDASFCIKHSENNDHSTKCKISKLCFEVNNESSTFGNILLSIDDCKSIPKSMKEAISIFAVYCRVSMLFESDQIWATILSDRLTKPYTFLYALEKLPPAKSPKMTIHIVTMSSAATDNPYFWHYLFHYNDVIEELNVVFVGPEVSPGFIEIRLCDDCIKKNRKINIQNVEALYPAFTTEKFFTKPDYVIGFDLRIFASPDIITAVIRKVAKLGCPFIVTSSFSESPETNQRKVNSILGKNVNSVWAGENPFRSWRPFKDMQSNEFIYDNEYLTIYEKLS